MNLKNSVGITALIIGAILIMYSAYNVNELLFLEGKTSETDIPLYGSTSFSNLFRNSIYNRWFNNLWIVKEVISFFPFFCKYDLAPS